MIEKSVSVSIPALGVTADSAMVKQYQVDQGIYVYDLFYGGKIVAFDRFSTVLEAPFVLTEAEQLKITVDTGLTAEAKEVEIARQVKQAAREAEFLANLPDWETVRLEYVALIDAAQAATTVTQLRKVVVDLAQRERKNARVLYHIARNSKV